MVKRSKHLESTLAAIVLALLSPSCVSSPRSERASAPASAAGAPQVLQAAPSPVTQENRVEAPAAEESEARDSARASSGAGRAAPAAAPAREVAQPVVPSHAKREAIPAARASKASDALNDDQPASAGANLLNPASAASADLREALLDFAHFSEQLSSSNSCEMACKAFQSMQRAATRICELALDPGSPSRCSAARNRVATASGDLKKRCGTCSN